MRVCALEGCDVSLHGKRSSARFCCDLHRTAQWKGTHRVAPQNGRERIARRSGPSGLQVSYRKAEAACRAAVADALSTFPFATEADMDTMVKARMGQALSPTQRARLEARS